MSQTSISANLRFNLNNKVVDAPIEWEDISIDANFEDGGVQPIIDIDSFTFVDKEAQEIREWISAGRIFEGIPFKIDAYNINTSKNSFDGYINCANNVELHEDTTVKANIQLAKGLTSVRDRLAGTTMSYLESIGVFTQADYTSVKYVVEKLDNKLEILMNIVVAFMLSVQLKQQVEKTGNSIATASGIFAAGFTGSVGSAIYLVASAILNLVFTLFMVVAILNLATQIFEALLPIPRTHKTLGLRTALTKIANHLGYTFSSPIALLDDLVYLPSNLETDDVNLLTGLINFPKGTKTGLPNERDYGFTGLEFFELCEKMFNANIKVNGTTLEFRSKNDPYWKQSSTYQMPNNLLRVKRFNTDELVFSRLIRFDTDEIADEWTLNNFKGTNYEIITNDTTITNIEAKYITKHETTSIAVSLGNRKDSLNGLENSLADLAGTVDEVINFFGGSSNLAGKITSRLGVLKVGTNNTTKPKLLYVKGGKLPSNHRQMFSAKVLYDLYINEKSFVLNNFGGQKALYSFEKLPFGFDNYLKSIENSNFVDINNNHAKFRSLNWLISGDTAEGEYEQKEIYTTTLTETYIEAQ